MFVPSIFSDVFYDDFFGTPATARDYDRRPNKKPQNHFMKTDVRENENGYDIEVELPGYKKEELEVQLENGYLTISANKNSEEKEEKGGKLIRIERYHGSLSRSFYVGEAITVEDISAKFENGVLALNVPKKSAAVPEKKVVAIG